MLQHMLNEIQGPDPFDVTIDIPVDVKKAIDVQVYVIHMRIFGCHVLLYVGCMDKAPMCTKSLQHELLEKREHIIRRIESMGHKFRQDGACEAH